MGTDDGGAAFPISGIDGCLDAGMSLRDYFASQAFAARLEGEAVCAMMATVACCFNEEEQEHLTNLVRVLIGPGEREDRAGSAYKDADAMIAESRKQ